MSQSGNLTGGCEFGVNYFTSSQRLETCGTNGLPLTPNSIRILGRSQFLKTLVHPHLCEYVEIIRGKNERIMIVSEFYNDNVSKFKRSNVSEKTILDMAYEILLALDHLNSLGLVNLNLSPENVLLDREGKVKLFNYGLHYMTHGGKWVGFPVGACKYTAPEVYLRGKDSPTTLPCSDVWSLGILILEMVLHREMFSGLKVDQITQKVANFAEFDGSLLDILVAESNDELVFKTTPGRLKTLLNLCLEGKEENRPRPNELLSNMTIFAEQKKTTGDSPNQPKLTNIELENGSDDPSSPIPHHNDTRPLKEVFHLWQLAGGDVLVELKRQGLTRKKASIISLMSSMRLEGDRGGSSKERGLLLDSTVITLPLVELKNRLAVLPPFVYYPLLYSRMFWEDHGFDGMIDSLPLIIREKDIEHQFHRILLFDRLLEGYPFTYHLLCEGANQDIPPFLRAKIWSALLRIEGPVKETYEAIDKDTPTSTDRQIEVDIPRCHQYDELLSSSSGHEKFKRILKAWVVSNKEEYVYWQGLDSLSAPFLYLNFEDEAMAFACLTAFIPKYLYKFFLKDNSAVIQEFLAKFSQLIAFHDPELRNHLDSIGFIPDLYAIPWFLTMFSHVFPLHKIFHLWDKLLLGDSTFSLCIGLSILCQLRESLLASGFNECILLFSDMPEMNMELCVKASVEMYQATPESCLARQHDPPGEPNYLLRKKREVIKSDETIDDQLRNSSFYQGLKCEPVGLEELKKEKCPRLSGEDFLAFLDVHRTKFPKPIMIVVDVRNAEDFSRGALPGSLNIPFLTAFGPGGELVQSVEKAILEANKGKIIAVVGNRGDSAIKFAENLVRLCFPKVTVLNKGIDMFRAAPNFLIVPSIK